MYSVQKNIIEVPPELVKDQICGIHLCLPDLIKMRKIEGGLRVSGKYKRNLADKPLISVITTVLNRELYIEKAICSVLNQSYDNVEYIIVDGGSADGTVDKILKYEDCIDYFVSEPDDGLYEGMNKGLSLATGDYILILNSDDWYEENCIKTLVNAIRKYKVEMVSGLAIETDRYGRFIRKIPKIDFGDNVRFRMPLRHETMLISKDLYNRVGPYDDDYKVIADLKLTINLYDNIDSFHQVDEYLMNFRKIGIASEVTPKLIKERKRLIREQFPFLSKNEIDILAKEFDVKSDSYRNMLKKYNNQQTFNRSLTAYIEMMSPGK